MVSPITPLHTPEEARQLVAANLRERRLQRNITQRELAARAGVALPTLRKFEQTGRISLASFLKLQMVLGGLDGILKATAPPEQQYASIDDVIKSDRKPPGRRRSRSRKNESR